MRQVGATILFASFLAMGSTPAAARETPGFIVRGAPISAPRGYIDMCNTQRSPLCDGEQIAVAAQAGGGAAASAYLAVVGDATGGIAMPVASLGAIELRAPCPVAPIAEAGFSAKSTDLAYDALRFRARFDFSPLSELLSAPVPTAWQMLSPPVGRTHRDCVTPKRASSSLAALTMLHARATGADGFVSGGIIPPVRQPGDDAATALAIYQAPAAFPAPARAAAPEIESRPVPGISALRTLRDINRSVNQRVIQRTDLQMYGRGEVWRRSGTGKGAQGDCEDLAIEKRLELISRGFPADRLFFAVVYRGDVGLHTVLISRLGDGDYVLDSLTPHIVPWTRAPYSWISAQAPGRPAQWYSVEHSRSVIASGTRAHDPEA